MAVHVGLTALLYALLTIARAPSVWGIGRRPDGSNPWAHMEPHISANLSNQFEWPLFFYAACMLMLQHPTIGNVELALAWLFIVGRLAHGGVQVLTTNVRLRGVIFTVNFVAVVAMWGQVLLQSSTS